MIDAEVVREKLWMLRTIIINHPSFSKENSLAYWSYKVVCNHIDKLDANHYEDVDWYNFMNVCNRYYEEYQ